MIYILALLISVFFAWLATIVKDKGKFLLFLSLVPLFILYAFRGNVGIDHYGYLDIFNTAGYTSLDSLYNLSNQNNIEPFFLLINSIVYKLGLDINAVYIICAFLTFFFYYKATIYYDSHRNYLIISIILFYSQVFFSGLDAVRQIVAVSIFFYSTKYIHQRRIFKFIVWTLIASLFHSSAVLLIPTYFILTRKINPWLYIIVSLLILFLSRVFDPSVIYELTENLMPKYDRYSERDLGYTNTVGLAYIIHLITCILIVFRQGEERNNKYTIVINMYLIFTALFPIASTLLTTKRLMYYFLIGITLGLPYGIRGMKNFELRRYRKALLLVYALLYLFLFLSSIKSGYEHPEWLHEPYNFMWE